MYQFYPRMKSEQSHTCPFFVRESQGQIQELTMSGSKSAHAKCAEIIQHKQLLHGGSSISLTLEHCCGVQNATYMGNNALVIIGNKLYKSRTYHNRQYTVLVLLACALDLFCTPSCLGY